MNRITNYQQENEEVIVSRILLAVQEQMDHTKKEKSDSHSKRLAKTVVTTSEALHAEAVPSEETLTDQDKSSPFLMNPTPARRSQSHKNRKTISKIKKSSRSKGVKFTQPTESTFFSLSTMNTRLFSKGVPFRIIIGLVIILAILILIGMTFLSD